MLVWPSSQRIRKRGGSSWSTSSITPLRTGWVTRSDSTMIRSPACAFISCTEDLTRVLDEAGARYELLPHARTESAVAEAEALGIEPADVAKTLVVRTPEGYVRVVLPASERTEVPPRGSNCVAKSDEPIEIRSLESGSLLSADEERARPPTRVGLNKGGGQRLAPAVC